MRATIFGFAIGLAMLLDLGGSAAQAQSGICQSLWVERNSIYKDAGYCFKTSRAIRYFGNAGCQYDNEASVPLSPGERARISQIIAEERSYGCR